MKVSRLAILLATIPILIFVPYFLFFKSDQPEKPEYPQNQNGPILNIKNKLKVEGKKLVLSEHRFEKKQFLKTNKLTKIQSSIIYLLYSPPEPWPKDLKFPLIIHLSDHNDTAFSAEYITQQQMTLAFPAFSVVPNIRGVYDKETSTSYNKGGSRNSKASVNNITNPTEATNYTVLRDQSQKILSPLMGLIEDIKTKYPIDSKRIYLVGCGFGGTALFNLIEKNPDVFASAVAISSAWETKNLKKFTPTPLLMMTGKNNTIFPSFIAKKFANDINKRGGKVKYQAIESMPHTCSYKHFYSNRVWKWMFSHQQNKSLSDY